MAGLVRLIRTLSKKVKKGFRIQKKAEDQFDCFGSNEERNGSNDFTNGSGEDSPLGTDSGYSSTSPPYGSPAAAAIGSGYSIPIFSDESDEEYVSYFLCTDGSDQMSCCSSSASIISYSSALYIGINTKLNPLAQLAPLEEERLELSRTPSPTGPLFCDSSSDFSYNTSSDESSAASSIASSQSDEPRRPCVRTPYGRHPLRSPPPRLRRTIRPASPLTLRTAYSGRPSDSNGPLVGPPPSQPGRFQFGSSDPSTPVIQGDPTPSHLVIGFKIESFSGYPGFPEPQLTNLRNVGEGMITRERRNIMHSGS